MHFRVGDFNSKLCSSTVCTCLFGQFSHYYSYWLLYLSAHIVRYISLLCAAHIMVSLTVMGINNLFCAGCRSKEFHWESCCSSHMFLFGVHVLSTAKPNASVSPIKSSLMSRPKYLVIKGYAFWCDCASCKDFMLYIFTYLRDKGGLLVPKWYAN